jgi:hypothetical protein
VSPSWPAALPPGGHGPRSSGFRGEFSGPMQAVVSGQGRDGGAGCWCPRRRVGCARGRPSRPGQVSGHHLLAAAFARATRRCGVGQSG